MMQTLFINCFVIKKSKGKDLTKILQIKTDSENESQLKRIRIHPLLLSRHSNLLNYKKSCGSCNLDNFNPDLSNINKNAINFSSSS